MSSLVTLKKKGVFFQLLVLSLFITPLMPVQASRAVQTCSNVSQVEPWLYRGGRPHQSDLEELVWLHVKTIINLESDWSHRNPDEVKWERQFADKNNIQFKHIPMHPFLRPTKKEVQEALAIILNPVNHPVFVHCRRGVDRTGIVIAAYRIKVQGWTAKRAYEEMKRYGHRHLLLFWWKDFLYQSEQAVLKSNTNSFERPFRVKKVSEQRIGDLSTPSVW